MSNDALLQAALIAARASDLEDAAVLFARRLVKQEPSSEQGWLGLGFCIPDKNKREYCFQRVLAINPKNTQARQALNLLEDTHPVVTLAGLQVQPSLESARKISESILKPVPIILPFLSEEGLVVEKSESVPFQTGIPNADIENQGREDQKENLVPVAPELIPEGFNPVKPVPSRKRTNKPLVGLLWLSLIFLFLCVAVFALLLLSGRIGQWLPINPVPTWTRAQFPTQTATPVPTGTPTDTTSPTPSPPAPTPLPTTEPTVVYTPVFAKTACWFTSPDGVVVSCGYVSVPEERTSTNSKTIQLAVALFHSTSPNPVSDPVIFLQGGPGGEAVMLSADNYTQLVKPFLSRRDFIAFDQRGTGISIPALGCDELESVYKQDIGGLIPASIRDYVYTNAFRSCHGAMTVGGIDLNSFTSLASSDDLKDIITVLGYHQVDLYAASYGTRLALVTMRDHPEVVRSAVLDSVVPVEVKLFDEDPIRYDSALQAMFDGCAADSRCIAAYPDLNTVFWNLVDQMDAKPVSVTAPLPVGSDTQNVNGGDLIGVILALLKTTRMIAYAPETIYSVKTGDYSTFVAMQSSLPYEFEGIDIGLYISMMCHEQILATTPQDLQLSMDSQHDVGRYFRLPFFGDAQTMFKTCNVWGAIPPAADENKPVVSSIPALIIEGKYDPVTPPLFGKQVAALLSHSYYMEFPNQGHTPTASDTSGCAFGTMLAFFDKPDEKPDMNCLSAIKGVDFIVPSQ